MNRRRVLLGVVATVAALLLVGRVVAGWYMEYLWYNALGASAVYMARASNLLLLRGAAFVVGALFVFVNLYAVRHSVVSLVLPKRVGNIEIGEEVPSRYLLAAVVVMSVVLGVLLALPHDDWTSLELVRHGDAFRESDPYFQLDLAFWVYWLPLEAAVHLWSLVTLLAVTLVVVVLYALTPSLRWEGGRLRISTYVRRHFFALGSILLILLGWSYRLDAYRLLLDGSGALGAFNALDHRVGIPANLILSLGTVAAAMLLFWAGWMAQLRLAFATVSGTLLLALTLRQFVPPIAQRFLDPPDPDARDASYVKTRAAYSRRAFDLDRIERADSGDIARTRSAALRGTALWDAVALERAVRRERAAALAAGPPGWEGEQGRMRAIFVEPPVGPDASNVLAPWRVARVDADMADDRGGPTAARTGGLDELELPAAVVYDSAPGYAVVQDSSRRIAAPTLESLASRVAHAWGLQNPRLLGSEGARSRARVVLHRDVRDRVRRIFPFFAQGARVSPLVYRDSLFWSVHLYSASDYYPLSDPVRAVDEETRYFHHAAVALVNSHTGRTFGIADITPDPYAASWIRRFPRLFVSTGALERQLVNRVAPPVEAALVQARVYARVGRRGENAPLSHLPRQHGGDTLFSYPTFSPFVDSASAKLALAYPVLDPTDRVRGVLIASGGAEYTPRWASFGDDNPRWTMIVDRLHRAIDSASASSAREAQLVRGPIRVIPFQQSAAYVQTAYAWRSDGTPAVRLVALFVDDTVRTGRTVTGAAGLPAPELPSAPITPLEFRTRIEALYADMRDALRRGDWEAFGAAYEEIGRLLQAQPAKP